MIDPADIENALLAITAACGKLALIRQRCEFAEHELPSLTWAQRWGAEQAAREIAAFLAVAEQKAA